VISDLRVKKFDLLYDESLVDNFIRNIDIGEFNETFQYSCASTRL